jgi:hypothetical protein
VTLHLTINSSTTSSESATACDSYSWHGTDYTASTNTATYTTTNAVGCDSTVTLQLTINYSTTSTESVTACDSYIWNGTTYTNSSIDSITSTNSVGCDSTTILHLTLNYSTSAIELLAACDSLEWHGTTYTESTDTPSFSTTNANGCDSTVTLHLTINYSSRTTIFDTATNSYEWNGETYTESGEYVYEGLTEAGCDSIVVLQLTINQVGIADVADLDGITIVDLERAELKLIDGIDGIFLSGLTSQTDGFLIGIAGEASGIFDEGGNTLVLTHLVEHRALYITCNTNKCLIRLNLDDIIILQTDITC